VIIERVLKKSGDALYVRSDGSLSADLSEAQRFDSFGAAVHCCRLYGLSQMELVLRLGPGHEIVSPIGTIY
jgi:hypothetical protein